MSNTVTCPNCAEEIAINEALQNQLAKQIRHEFEQEIKEKNSALELEKRRLAKQESELAEAQAQLDAKVKTEVAAERAKIEAAARKEAKESIAVELQDSMAQRDELKKKLSQAQANELDLRKKERELEAQTEELKLTVARQIDAERDKIRQEALKQIAEERELKDAEKEKLISDMKRQIDDLKRKAEQGSMQTQGEVQELALESMLEAAFPMDTIQPVGKGVSGADCEQVVACPTSGSPCGSILWESKRTKSYSKSWLPKLRDDQRAARATVAVLVTQALPEDVDTFTEIDGVWVCSWRCAKALSAVLRSGLIDLNRTNLASQGRAEKMELVYNYLASAEFQQRVEGVVEAFSTMQSDLQSEQKAMKRIWSKREKQIDRALNNTAGLYGDLQGIIGASLPTVEGLSLRRIAAVEESDEILSIE